MPTKKILYGCEARGDAHSPYLTRYTLIDRPGGQLCLHVFHRSDADEHHDHPWPFVSLMLWRGYTEVTPKGRRRVWPGQVLFRPATWRHRVELLRSPCPNCGGTGYGYQMDDCEPCGGSGQVWAKAVTLIWMGKRRRDWGFFTPRGWQEWRSYFREKGC